ncbi:interleukin-1 receptor accessory protein-like 1 [Coccinella septempunctata]|uniref:interleukin-1 receptor accessory protein-like 1 n=1 Tax=Coccinella septempunctata TaxID=41139 RepID=UPI001D095CC2|nr:interleukin-1 receptor accessory protein-like 1 [Coccinella septempunctata]
MTMFIAVISLFCVTALQVVLGIETYCLNNNYVTNGTHMQFTKEPSVEEFAILGTFKGLHCCAKNYRSIEWYKNGKPYPWPLTSSQLILYPEDANQTVYTKSVSEKDAGNYTCILRNDTVVHSHTIILKVLAKVPDEPQVTYVSRDAEVAIGANLRLFCEAFGGRIDLPDAHNEAIWFKMDSNRTLSNGTRIRQEKTSREDDQTFGTYLIINDIQPEDFGIYVCTIKKPGITKNLTVSLRQKVMVEYINPNPFPIEKMLLLMIAATLLLLAFFVLNLRFGLELRLKYKNTFGPLEEEDGKINDALILYSGKDEDMALNILLPKLEVDYNYKAGCKRLPSSVDAWITELHASSKKSRRIIFILSPSALNGNWDTATIYKAIKVLDSLGPSLICLVLEKLPTMKHELKNSQGETLKSTLYSVDVIDWNNPPSEKCWKNLCLRMPARRHFGLSEQNAQRPNKRTVNRQESLDNLV